MVCSRSFVEILAKTSKGFFLLKPLDFLRGCIDLPSGIFDCYVGCSSLKTSAIRTFCTSGRNALVNTKSIRVHWLNRAACLVAEVKCAFVCPLWLTGYATRETESFSVLRDYLKTTETTIGGHISKSLFLSKIPTATIITGFIFPQAQLRAEIFERWVFVEWLFLFIWFFLFHNFKHKKALWLLTTRSVDNRLLNQGNVLRTLKLVGKDNDRFDKVIQSNREDNGANEGNNLFLCLVFHIQVMRDCLVARRIVLICGGAQCQAFALCNEALSFLACRLDTPVKRCSSASLRVSCAS